MFDIDILINFQYFCWFIYYDKIESSKTKKHFCPNIVIYFFYFSAAEKEYKSEEIQHDLEWHVTEVSGAQSADPHPGGAEEKRPMFPLPGGGSSLLQRVSVGKWPHQ